MLISIITVCLNSVCTIRHTIESIRNQTWNNIEHIIIDGLSTDGTLYILGEYSNSQTRIISEPDSGIYDAMNKGLCYATGEIIYFLNSDDTLCDPYVLNDVNREFKNHPETDLLYGNVIYQNEYSRSRRSFRHITRRNIIYEDLCHQSLFTRRHLFEKIGRFDLSYKINADYDWILKLFYSDYITRYFDRDIAFFYSAGAHSWDENFLLAERLNIKLKYHNRIAYRVGETIYRIIRKIGKLNER